MAYLEIFASDAPPEQLELSSERTSIGRADDNAIVLSSRGVSKYHAIIEKHGNSFVLIDNNSANGVYVNGQRIVRHDLKPWDEIQIFTHVLMFGTSEKQHGEASSESGGPPDTLLPDATVEVDIASLGDLVRLKKRTNIPALTQIQEMVVAPVSNSLYQMRSQTDKHSMWGFATGVCAVVIATLITGYFQTGSISFQGFLEAQRTSVALWLLNILPFVFVLWAKHVGTKLTENVNTLVTDRTADLQRKTEALESQAVHDATHDPLTDLPNRLLLRDRLEQALLNMRRTQLPLALMVLDLDRFKEINDTLGHQSGDRLLKLIAVRLREVVFATDTLARLGGDEFAILLPSLDAEDDIHKVVKKIQLSLATPFVIDRMSLDVQASIGISLAPKHGQDMQTLLQRADVAMYVAKEQKRHFYIYDPSIDKHSSWRLSLLAQLRQAIADDDLQVVYQPKMAASTEQVQGVEALVRWNHQEFGLVSPDEFIHLAEQSGLIVELTRWVLRTVVDQIMVWRAQGRDLGVAVNVSASILLDPEFPDFMAGQLAAQKLPSGTLTLEITESSLVRDPELALQILNQLTSQGISISIDDFGTGYSSLAYLKKMSASELKIDKAFVTDMLINESDATIVRATIDLAHNLGLTVVAEGVENAQTARALAQLDCDALQGFHYSPPLPIEQFNAWLAAQDGRPTWRHRGLRIVP